MIYDLSTTVISVIYLLKFKFSSSTSSVYVHVYLLLFAQLNLLGTMQYVADYQDVSSTLVQR